MLWFLFVAFGLLVPSFKSHLIPVGQLYAGRAIGGLAIGQTTTIGPAYLSEVAPRQIRGLCGCILLVLCILVSCCCILPIMEQRYTFLTLLATMGYTNDFENHICRLNFNHVILFCYESPRWLIKVNRPDDAIDRLSKIRNLPKDHPYIVERSSDINEQIMTEKEAVGR